MGQPTAYHGLTADNYCLYFVGSNDVNKYFKIYSLTVFHKEVHLFVKLI